MSSGRLFLDRVARQHCPSPLHRHAQNNMHSSDAGAKGDISTLRGRGHFYFALTHMDETLTTEPVTQVEIAEAIQSATAEVFSTMLGMEIIAGETVSGETAGGPQSGAVA